MRCICPVMSKPTPTFGNVMSKELSAIAVISPVQPSPLPVTSITTIDLSCIHSEGFCPPYLRTQFEITPLSFPSEPNDAPETTFKNANFNFLAVGMVRIQIGSLSRTTGSVFGNSIVSPFAHAPAVRVSKVKIPPSFTTITPVAPVVTLVSVCPTVVMGMGAVNSNFTFNCVGSVVLSSSYTIVPSLSFVTTVLVSPAALSVKVAFSKVLPPSLGIVIIGFQDNICLTSSLSSSYFLELE